MSCHIANRPVGEVAETSGEAPGHELDKRQYRWEGSRERFIQRVIRASKQVAHI